MSSPKDKPSKSRSRITKAELEQKLEAAQSVVKEQKSELARYRKKLDTLELQLQESQEKNGNEMESIPVSTSLFRITLYDPGQGPLQGKIEYPLTKAKKAFKGLDQDAISAFIISHLPDEKKEKLQSTTSRPKQAQKAPSTDTDLPQISTLEVIPKEYSQPKKLVNHDTGFNIRLVLNTASSKKKAKEIPYHVMLYAKQLESGVQQMAGGVTKVLEKGTDTISIPVGPEKLSPGTYLLEAALSRATSESDIPKITPLEGSSIIQVY